MSERRRRQIEDDGEDETCDEKPSTDSNRTTNVSVINSFLKFLFSLNNYLELFKNKPSQKKEIHRLIAIY